MRKVITNAPKRNAIWMIKATDEKITSLAEKSGLSKQDYLMAIIEYATDKKICFKREIILRES